MKTYIKPETKNFVIEPTLMNVTSPTSTPGATGSGEMGGNEMESKGYSFRNNSLWETEEEE